jgi:hypothetical protein
MITKYPYIILTGSEGLKAFDKAFEEEAKRLGIVYEQKQKTKTSNYKRKSSK